MKNLKKVMALIIAFAMMLTFVTGAAFAEETTDEEAAATEETAVEEEVVEEEVPEVVQPISTDAGKYASSVLRAQKFGIMIGDDKGDLKPNNPVTRAEFMTMLVRALGYEDAAVAAKGTTKFADVAAEHWASGYVNVTVQLGVTKGKSETSFAPDDNVTTTEALAFIERAMGYEVLANEKGGWPTGYLVLAKDKNFGLNLLDGVTESVNLPAPRGLIAKLFDNSMAAGFYEVDSYSDGVPTYHRNPSISFLTKMGYKKLDDNGTADGGDKFILAQIPYLGSDDDKIELIPVEKRGNTSSILVRELSGEFDLESLMGQRVEVYHDEDDKIVDIQTVEDEKTEVVVIDEIKLDGSSIKIKDVDGSEKKYDAVGDVLPYVCNFDNFVATKAEEDANAGKVAFDSAFAAAGRFGDKTDLIEATAVIFDGKVDFIYGFKYTSPLLVDDTVENNVTGVKSVRVKVSPTASYYINNADDETAKFYEIIKDGEVADFSDLEENDVLYVAALKDATVAKNAKDNRIRFVAVNDMLTGELKAATLDAASKVTKVRIDSTTYELYPTVANKELTTADPTGWGVKYGNTVNIRLTRNGKVFDIEFESGSVTKEYAVVLNKATEPGRYGSTTKYVKLLKADGEDFEYTVKKDSDLDKANFNTKFAKGDLVEYELNADNELLNLKVAGLASADGGTNKVGDVDKRMVDGKIANEDATLFNVTDDNAGNTDDAEADVISWGNLRKDSTDVAQYFFDDDNSFLVAVKFLNASGDEKYAVIADKYAIEDSKNAVTLITKDGSDEYNTDATIAQGIGAFIKYSLSGSGEVTGVTAVAATVSKKEIENITSTNIKVDGAVRVFADDVVVYYNKDLDPTEDFEALTVGDLYKYMEVTLYVNADNQVIGVAVSKK